MGNAVPAVHRPYSTAVHPHARGERPFATGSPWTRIGSSPRPWGTLKEAAGPWMFDRFIPTPVGNAGYAIGDGWNPTVHPHARGERGNSRSCSRRSHGSSPRPWGTRRARPGDGGWRRFIPTPVGNAGYAIGDGWNPTVHPHARGERMKKAGFCRLSYGSSPRPWGTPLVFRGGIR